MASREPGHHLEAVPAEAGALSLSELLGELWLPTDREAGVPLHPSIADPDDLPPAA